MCERGGGGCARESERIYAWYMCLCERCMCAVHVREDVCVCEKICAWCACER